MNPFASSLLQADAHASAFEDYADDSLSCPGLQGFRLPPTLDKPEALTCIDPKAIFGEPFRPDDGMDFSLSLFDEMDNYSMAAQSYTSLEDCEEFSFSYDVPPSNISTPAALSTRLTSSEPYGTGSSVLR
ncbi:hypothetical protein NM688_g7155 [Phlebia brevispora]|uniref:Uncharacterized protein n=1 Tax=Phlebia brevispora TaxID=194682 RepID=A0ACC1S8Q3_9APHY|nr:hypothetical protein NM688_g7155 [Phlebia brevispora]